MAVNYPTDGYARRLQSAAAAPHRDRIAANANSAVTAISSAADDEAGIRPGRQRVAVEAAAHARDGVGHRVDAISTWTTRCAPEAGNIAPESIQSGISATLMIAW